MHKLCKKTFPLIATIQIKLYLQTQHTSFGLGCSIRGLGQTKLEAKRLFEASSIDLNYRQPLDKRQTQLVGILRDQQSFNQSIISISL